MGCKNRGVHIRQYIGWNGPQTTTHHSSKQKGVNSGSIKAENLRRQTAYLVSFCRVIKNMERSDPKQHTHKSTNDTGHIDINHERHGAKVQMCASVHVLRSHGLGHHNLLPDMESNTEQV